MSMNELLQITEEAILTKQLVKITLSKSYRKDIVKVVIKPVELKGELCFNFHFTYTTNDQTKNYTDQETLEEFKVIASNFKAINVYTSQKHYTYLVNKKGKGKLLKTKQNEEVQSLIKTHDREKIKRAPLNSPYLFHLGVATKEGQLIPKMADKYRQINKYLEIIDDMLKNYTSQQIKVVDMGSGKGYLTFALYDFLSKKGLNTQVVGVEFRPDLVDKCNAVAEKCGFNQLKFVEGTIDSYKDSGIDLLIALHACDTATDDAIYKGLIANSKYVICAPCCHKQLRKSTKGQSFDNPLMRFGIFQERQFEMLTDTIRALILESKGYKTKVFEFVSNEHTRKNIMLIGERKAAALIDDVVVRDKIERLKSQYGLGQHYLENLLED